MGAWTGDKARPGRQAGEPRRQTKRFWSRSRYTREPGPAVTLAAAGAVLPEKLLATASSRRPVPRRPPTAGTGPQPTHPCPARG
jgi:hypothetical protein